MSDPELLGLIAQAQRYAFAAEQDAHPVVRLTHWGYARLLYETALRAAPRARLRAVSGVDVDAALMVTERGQQEATQALVAACPQG